MTMTTNHINLQYPRWSPAAEHVRWATVAYAHDHGRDHVRSRYVAEWLDVENTHYLGQRLKELREAEAIGVRTNNSDGNLWHVTDDTRAYLAGTLVSDLYDADPSAMTVLRRTETAVEDYEVGEQNLYEYHDTHEYTPTPFEAVVEVVYGEYLPGELYTRHGELRERGQVYGFPEGRLRPPTQEMVRPYFDRE